MQVQSEPDLSLFSYFQARFFKMFSQGIFEVVTSFVASTYPINSFFSSEVRFYKIHHAFDEAFFLLATIIMITENVSDFCFHGKHCWGNIILLESCSLSIQTIPEKV